MSNFCDQTVVEFIGGRGGDGSIHFRKEKYIPRGGPDGGDGGVGGSITLVADENINTLFDFNSSKVFRAEDGENGQKKNMTGKSGDSLELKVPAGTILYDAKNHELICDLKKQGQRVVIARGGRGGYGNYNFKSSVHQAPQFAEKGEEGEKRVVMMELQLVADIGIIGFPSAGKSTLISRISNAKPKIADYPFTTLIPNLGVVAMKDFDKRSKDSFVVADIPGLIEGAHAGKGLGHEFLRHVSRTEALVHLIDPTRGSPDDYQIINQELKKFDEKLAQKVQIVCLSKADCVDAETIELYREELISINKKLKGKIMVFSSATGEGLKELVYAMYKQVQKVRKARIAGLTASMDEITQVDEKIFKPHLKEKKWEVIFRRTKLEAATGKTRKIFDVKGGRIEQVVNMTDIENEEGMERIYHFLKKMGIMSELTAQGAKAGDRIRITDKTFIMR